MSFQSTLPFSPSYFSPFTDNSTQIPQEMVPKAIAETKTQIGSPETISSSEDWAPFLSYTWLFFILKKCFLKSDLHSPFFNPIARRVDLNQPHAFSKFIHMLLSIVFF